ncbi:MAG: biotin--[acetyl-CoA-carboxylase] ligase [Defluviitaleaceae bacterium]|nr:biotin--[acetyl-CoA-carboxylase] ligase [Defluviitaleaceae bacterium]
MGRQLKPGSSTRLCLLALLEARRGQSVSGEQIAGLLGISRAAVWKAVKELEKHGYKISAGKNKGYCLHEENDILSAQGILAHLRIHENDMPLFEKSDAQINIHVFPTIDSTNTEAKKMAVAGAEHGTVVIADQQTAGKGRYGRSFFSPSGHGVYMSFVLHMSRIWLSVPTLVTSFSAVAVCRAIEAVSNKKPRIKWVNDVFIDGKKVCGISTEAVTDYESGEIQWIVLGIGVNLSAPEGGFPENLKNIAGSVFSKEEHKSGKDPGNLTITRNQLAAEIIKRIFFLENKGEQTETKMLADYKSRLLMLGEKITVSSATGAAGKAYKATALDIDNIGRLIVKTEKGETVHLSAGQISVALSK